MEERKVEVEDPDAVESWLSTVATHRETTVATDVYFGRPGRSVLKLRRERDADWLVRFEPDGDGFRKVLDRRVENGDAVRERLAARHGVEAVLDKRVERYEWRAYDVLLVRIDDVGEFLVVQGDSVPPRVLDDLGVGDRPVVDVPFGDLAGE